MLNPTKYNLTAYTIKYINDEETETSNIFLGITLIGKNKLSGRDKAPANSTGEIMIK